MLSFVRVGAKFEISSMSDYFYSREWMDRHIDPINNFVSREFKEWVDVFIAFSSNQNSFLVGKTMLCPCSKCQNRKQRDSRTVSRHLYRVEFKSNNYLWLSHGENYYDVGESSTGGQFMGEDTLHTEKET